MRYRTQLFLAFLGAAALVGLVAMNAPPYVDRSAEANAKLDAEIKRALDETGVYVPPNALEIDYKARALTLCSRHAKATVRHPSTFSFSGWGSRVMVREDNSADVTATFKAKNSYGLELRHRIECRVSPEGEVTAQIVEAG